MKWQSELANLIGGVQGKVMKSFASANSAAVKECVAGKTSASAGGGRKTTGESGARTVFNISASHIPGLVQESLNGDGKPYKNAYDLGTNRVGDKSRVSETRRTVDEAIRAVANIEPEDIYFGAVELNGPGMRFYGDICLVLHPDKLPADTSILDRNSYDLTREPIKSLIDEAIRAGIAKPSAYADEARNLVGKWDSDLADIAAIKVLGDRIPANRRLTTGSISEGILSDEDYIEVLNRGSFGHADVEEARSAAADAALDARITERALTGPIPSLSEFVWQHNRRRAETALATVGIHLRIITSSGRVRL